MAKRTETSPALHHLRTALEAVVLVALALTLYALFRQQRTLHALIDHHIERGDARLGGNRRRG